MTQTLSPDALITQTNLAGAVAAIQDDPDAPDATWLTSPALATPAVKKFYLLGADASTVLIGSMQEDGTAPANALFSANTSSVGFIAGASLASGLSSEFRLGTERAATTFTSQSTTPKPGAPNSTAPGNFFRTPTALTGDFANAAWTLSILARSQTAAYTGRGRFRFRVYKSTDPNGTGATQLTTTDLLTNASTANLGTTNATATTFSVTWSPGALTLNGEYLFFVFAFETTAAGTTGAGQDINLMVGSASAITTPTYTPKEPNGLLRISIPTPTNRLDLSTNHLIKVWARLKGAGIPTLAIFAGSNTSRTSIALVASPVSNTTGQMMSGNISGPGISGEGVAQDGNNLEFEIQTANIAGGSIEIGAVEVTVNNIYYAGATLNGLYSNKQRSSGRAQVWYSERQRARSTLDVRYANKTLARLLLDIRGQDLQSVAAGAFVDLFYRDRKQAGSLMEARARTLIRAGATVDSRYRDLVRAAARLDAIYAERARSGSLVDVRYSDKVLARTRVDARYAEKLTARARVDTRYSERQHSGAISDVRYRDLQRASAPLSAPWGIKTLARASTDARSRQRQVSGRAVDAWYGELSLVPLAQTLVGFAYRERGLARALPDVRYRTRQRSGRVVEPEYRELVVADSMLDVHYRDRARVQALTVDLRYADYETARAIIGLVDAVRGLAGHDAVLAWKILSTFIQPPGPPVSVTLLDSRTPRPAQYERLSRVTLFDDEPTTSIER